MKRFAPWFLVAALCTFTAFAQDNDALPNNYAADT